MDKLNKLQYVIILMIFLLTACSHSDKKSNDNHVITVEPQSLSTSLYFSGAIQPLKTTVVTSPAEGVVDDMSFHYGDEVKPNQILFVISSEKFKLDYKNALMQYIKSKNEYTNAKSLLTQSQFLHKNQLISDDDFKSKQSGYYNAQLSLVQSQDTLAVLIKQLAVPGLSLDQLKIENIDKITQILNLQNNLQKLRVSSPVSGVALVSVKSGSGEDVKKIEKGDQVKQGDVIAVIGDVSGLSIHVNVNEFNINQLKVGQKVKVTGAAFPSIVLQGEIKGLDHQGQVTAGGVPNFPVEVIVPRLTATEQAIIHIGMSAKVEVVVEQPKTITVPITAVVQKNDDTFVNVKDVKSGERKMVVVKTGETTLDAIVIESGLHAGDQIIVPG